MRNKILQLLLLVLPVMTLFAQPLPPDGGDYGTDGPGPGGPTDPNPIDQYLILLAIFALVLGYYYMVKKRSKVVTE